MEKIVLVSFASNGRRIQAFVKGEVGEDGKVRISENTMLRLFRALGVERGQTVRFGG